MRLWPRELAACRSLVGRKLTSFTQTYGILYHHAVSGPCGERTRLHESRHRQLTVDLQDRPFAFRVHQPAYQLAMDLLCDVHLDLRRNASPRLLGARDVHACSAKAQSRTPP
jgi:hypothetical protein